MAWTPPDDSRWLEEWSPRHSLSSTTVDAYLWSECPEAVSPYTPTGARWDLGLDSVVAMKGQSQDFSRVIRR